MKKITAFLLIICILMCQIPALGNDASDEKRKVYLFGDEWAAQWGLSFKDFFCHEDDFVFAAQNKDLLSQITKKSEYSKIKKDDIVILSYGVMEKDRPGDKNADFNAALQKVSDDMKKKGAVVIFASICSTMRFNTLTGQMAETRNFYTETTRAFAKKAGCDYVDLAKLTADCASRAGSGRAGVIYTGNLSLTEDAKKRCAYEVFKSVVKNDGMGEIVRSSLSRIYDGALLGTYAEFDNLIFEDITKSYTIYIKNGVNVIINNQSVGSGDITFRTECTDGKIRMSFTSCEKVQLSPLFKFDAAGFSTKDTPYVGKILPGCYDVTVKKTEPLKASVYLNDYLVASNLDMPGTQKVESAAEHTFGSFDITNDDFSVRVTGLTDKLEYIYFTEEENVFSSRPRVFVGGDSTVCNYYPLIRYGNEPDGQVMTGWAMLLENYIEADVMNLAASGDWASNWLEKSFPVVEKEGQKGDYFVVQFGINDHDKSTVADMTAALGEMIERSAAKGLIPILVSPQISAGYGWGNTSDLGKSDGGAYAEFFNAVRNLADEKGCFYVDLTDLSAGWFSEVGRDGVYKKYHLWDYEKNAPGDMMHLSYSGANTMCAFFVRGLEKIIESGKCDKWGNSLQLLKIL